MTHKNTQPTTEAVKSELSCSSTLNDLNQFVSDHATYWIDFYNKSPLTDQGESVSDFAKGAYMACLEIKKHIEELQHEPDDESR